MNLKHQEIKNGKDGKPKRCFYRFVNEGGTHVTVRCDWPRKECVVETQVETAQGLLVLDSSEFDLPNQQLSEADALRIAVGYFGEKSRRAG